MTSALTPREIKLGPMQEFRFEVDPKQHLALKILEGKAELFGSEMAINTEYEFTARKACIFTWTGCKIESKGQSVEYVGHEVTTPMHLKIHLALEEERKKAKENDTEGPRVMIVGPADAGKTSLAKTLVSYASRHGSSTLLCDIDPEEGFISLPGTLSAMAITRPLDIEEEFGGSSSVYNTTPLCYYYGASDIQEKRNLYESLIQRLAESVDSKLKDPLVKHGGLIIDTPSQFVVQNKLESIRHAIESFRANVIIVLGDEKLLNILKNDYPHGVTILKVGKSGGVVARDKDIRRQFQLYRVKQYFYGGTRTTLTPFSQTVPFGDLIVRRAIVGSVAPSSALPIGMEANPNEVKFIKVETGDILLHSILAVTFADLPGGNDVLDDEGKPRIYTPEEETDLLLKRNISGFIFVSEVDDKKRKLTVLGPNPSRLPKTFLMMGSLKWMDT